MPTSDFHDAKTQWAKIKHGILGKYLPVFINKLSSFNGRIDLVDGFAGAGRYGDGQPGSALISAKIAASPRTDTSRGKLHCINVEKHPAAFAKLVEETKPYTDLGFVENIQGEFERKLPEILCRIEGDAALFFIDPFGTAGATTGTLELISKRKGATEVLVRFDPARVSRLLNFNKNADYVPDSQAAKTEARFWERGRQLTDAEGQQAAVLNDPGARKIIVDGYIKLVTKELGLFGYGLAYPIVNPKTMALRYYLVHFSDHPDGYAYMANYMAEVQRTIDKVTTQEKEFALFGPESQQLEIMEIRASAIAQHEQSKVNEIVKKLPAILKKHNLEGRTVERRQIYAAIVDEFAWTVLLKESKRALLAAEPGLLKLHPGSKESCKVEVHPIKP